MAIENPTNGRYVLCSTAISKRGIKLEVGLNVINIHIKPNASGPYVLDCFFTSDNFTHTIKNIPKMIIPPIAMGDLQCWTIWKPGSIVRLKGNIILRKYSKGITPICVRK